MNNMNNDDTREQLREENRRLRERIALLEAAASEHKRTEKQLRHNQRLLSTVLNTVPAFITLIDTHGNILLTNESVSRYFGKSPDEMGGKNVYAMMPPELAEARKDYNDDAIRTGKVVIFEDAFHERYMQNHTSPIFDAQGAVSMLAIFALDITERKRAEATIRASEARLLLAQRVAHFGNWEWNLETNAVYWSEEMYHILHIPLHAMPLEAINEAIHPDDREFVWNASRAAIDDHQPFDLDFRVIGAHGVIHYIHDQGEVIYDDAGTPKAMFGTMQDITARKQAEEEVRRLNAELEHRVIQRTTELEAANKELQSFAYVVSHDLKAPLRGIAQLAHWLVEDYAKAFDAHGQEMAALLINRVKRMDNLIEGILEYSRIGRIVEKQASIDPNRLIKEVIDLLAPPEQIHIHVQPELPTIIGDATRIAELFQNLIGNAVKFMEKPAGEVRVGCADCGAYWQFQVTDNGPGIDGKYHDKIFQLFQTLTPRDDQENTGIGLAIVKKIVEFYGGRIWVESIVGQGSSFFFTLPK